jgi:hypothetical protein
MWGSVLGLALMLALNPMLLGVILLMLSRPRPVQNLLAYWVGCLIVDVPCLLVPLMVLHLTPSFTSFAKDMATPTTAAGTTVRHIQFGMGVLALAIAALMTVRFVARQRERAQLPTPDGDTSILVLDSNTPTVIPWLGRAPDAATDGGSAIRRLLGRLNNAWENGSVWVAFVLGLGSTPPPLLVLFVDTTIVASGAAIGTQVSAAIVFVVGMFAVVEITLVSYLVTPVKTQALLRPLHDWALAHRQQILIAMFTVGGVSLVANSIGTV